MLAFLVKFQARLFAAFLRAYSFTNHYSKSQFSCALYKDACKLLSPRVRLGASWCTSASVAPTQGYKNVVLTIVALPLDKGLSALSAVPAKTLVSMLCQGGWQSCTVCAPSHPSMCLASSESPTNRPSHALPIVGRLPAHAPDAVYCWLPCRRLTGQGTDQHTEMDGPNSLKGVAITGPITPEYEVILTPEALSFVAHLARCFTPRVTELLKRRVAVQVCIHPWIHGSLCSYDCSTLLGYTRRTSEASCAGLTVLGDRARFCYALPSRRGWTPASGRTSCRRPRASASPTGRCAAASMPAPHPAPLLVWAGHAQHTCLLVPWQPVVCQAAGRCRTVDVPRNVASLSVLWTGMHAQHTPILADIAALPSYDEWIHHCIQCMPSHACTCAGGAHPGRHRGPAVRDHRPRRPQDGHQRAQQRRLRLHGRLRGLQHAHLVRPLTAVRASDFWSWLSTQRQLLSTWPTSRTPNTPTWCALITTVVIIPPFEPAS